MNIILVFIFFIVFIFFGNELGYSEGAPVWKHFTYMFQHGSLWHLIINSFALYFLWDMLVRFVRHVVLLFISLGVAVGASFIVSYDMPVVGASSMVYALIGIYFALVASFRIGFLNGYSWFWVSLSCVVVVLFISFLREHSAGVLHALCLAGGFAVAYYLGKYKII